MNNIINFFKSMKLAVILMILISIFTALGTFIPQYQVKEYYISHYGELFGNLIRLIQLDHYSNSIIFGLLMVLFFLNTFVCTYSRIQKVYPSLFSKKVNSNNIIYFNGSKDELFF